MRELLFDGYNDLLLTALKALPAKLGIVVPPFNKFGYFVDRNGSAVYDGQFEMYAGQSSQFARMGSLTKWNYSNKTRYYRDECSRVNGTSGELWPMHMGPKADISLFITDLCRPLTLAYQQNHERYSIVGSRWVGDYRVFDNGERYAPNKCFCPRRKAACPDLAAGVHDMSECRYGAPLFASFPHFYLANETYVTSIGGMKPNQSLHEFAISLEPTTGVPLDIDAKLQINTFLQPTLGVPCVVAAFFAHFWIIINFRILMKAIFSDSLIFQVLRGSAEGNHGAGILVRPDRSARRALGQRNKGIRSKTVRISSFWLKSPFQGKYPLLSAANALFPLIKCALFPLSHIPRLPCNCQ